jgi:putative oxidoreductase
VYRVTTKDAALVPMRAALGATMLYHGASKLRGDGPEQTGQMFEQLGIRPGRTWAMITAAAEVLAGATSLLGFATRAGALAVVVSQAVAIAKVHRPKGFSVANGGYEFNLALMAIALGILLAGPGAVSVHEVIERRAQRRPWTLLRPRRRAAFRAAMRMK